MMIFNKSNITETQPMQNIEIQSPEVPMPSLSPDSLDPANPLAWILCLTLLLGNTDEVINAVAKLIRAIASLNDNREHQQDTSDSRD